MSDSSQDTINQWKYMPKNIKLVIENGYMVNLDQKSSGWQTAIEKSVFWQSHVIKIMNLFQKNVQGSYIEVNKSQIIWNTALSHPEISHKQAIILARELRALIEKMKFDDLEVVQEKTQLIVKFADVNKGIAAQTLIQYCAC